MQVALELVEIIIDGHVDCTGTAYGLAVSRDNMGGFAVSWDNADGLVISRDNAGELASI